MTLFNNSKIYVKNWPKGVEIISWERPSTYEIVYKCKRCGMESVISNMDLVVMDSIAIDHDCERDKPREITR